ncbi:hypothetical protein L1987_36126 [Smallanthus sonchifolius]|uniref:Uncharacterized protein n=1 Tax=Smallanthus sonchifolius TaxID=185202 RepID=A0ACB9HCQ9_9ASTR|nr:hypothetical protein L1987_36126 [Smallanthus sonchifolius]
MRKASLSSKSDEKNDKGDPATFLATMTEENQFQKQQRSITMEIDENNDGDGGVEENNGADDLEVATIFAQLSTEMADNSIVVKNDDESNKPTNPFSSLFSKFTQVINFPLPFLPPAKKDVVKVETERKAIIRGGEVVEVSKSAKVTYPDGLKKTVPPLKLESEEAEKETNPAVLWQVYVIGGFFILKWAWGRWNEHKERKKPSNDDQPSSSPPTGDGN